MNRGAFNFTRCAYTIFRFVNLALVLASHFDHTNTSVIANLKHKTHMLRYLIVCIIFVLLFSGCATHKSDYDPSTLVPEAVMNSLADKQVDASYLLKTMGQPVKVQRNGERRVLYTYALKNVSVSGKKRYVFFGERKAISRIDYLHVLLRDDKVVKHWIDEYILVMADALNARKATKQFAPVSDTPQLDALEAP